MEIILWLRAVRFCVAHHIVHASNRFRGVPRYQPPPQAIWGLGWRGDVNKSSALNHLVANLDGMAPDVISNDTLVGFQ